VYNIEDVKLVSHLQLQYTQYTASALSGGDALCSARNRMSMSMSLHASSVTLWTVDTVTAETRNLGLNTTTQVWKPKLEAFEMLIWRRMERINCH